MAAGGASGGLAVAAFVAALVVLSSGSAIGQTFCTKPVQPFCIDQDLTYQDERIEEECALEVDRYVNEIDDYADCLSDQADEARSSADFVRERFACQRQGRTDCPDAPSHLGIQQ